MKTYVEKLRKRLLCALEENELTMYSCAENPAAQVKMSRQLRENGAALTIDTIYRIVSKIPDLSMEWLIRGDGAMMLHKNAVEQVVSNNPTTIHRQSAHNLHNGTGDINDGVSSSDSDALKVAMEALKQNAELIQLLSNK